MIMIDKERSINEQAEVNAEQIIKDICFVPSYSVGSPSYVTMGIDARLSDIQNVVDEFHCNLSYESMLKIMEYALETKAAELLDLIKVETLKAIEVCARASAENHFNLYGYPDYE
jgi:hypothetical protein